MKAPVTAESQARKSKPEVSAGHAEPASSLEAQSGHGAPAGMPLFLGIGLQPRLAVGTVDDPLEREADHVAQQTMRMPEPAAASRYTSASSAAAPPIVREALSSPGQPLDAATRASFEPRLGHDLESVRIHADSRAAQAADAVQARAYTLGPDIVFGAGEYAPSTARGTRLLAHELAHVVHQAGGHSAVIQRDHKKDTPPDPNLQKIAPPIAKAIAEADADMAQQLKQKGSPIFVHEPMNYKGLKALLPLAEAIDDERTVDIPKLADAFIKAEPPPPFNALSEPMLIQMSARLFTLGLGAVSDKLRENYSSGAKKLEILNVDWGKRRRDIAVYRAIVERTIAVADDSTPQKSKASLVQMIRALDMLRPVILAVDQEALRFESPEAERIPPFEAMTLHQYWNALIDVLTTAVTGIETHLQILLERAATDLSEGRGSATLLMARDVVENKLAPAILPADGKNNIGGIRLKVTKTDIKAGEGFSRDVLSKDAKRSVAVSTYTPGQEYVRELENNLAGLVDIRIDQIATMAGIYGATDVLREDKPAEKKRKEDAVRNAETMKKLIAQGGKLRLDSDSDWQKFVLQKFQDMTAAAPNAVDKGKALSAVISLLFDYLQAFTVHARFTNIYDIGDFKDAYFDKPFPRTLGGQLVHDCGVYAMRVAYILSLVREQLGLRFRFIHLPAHLGLIITGDGLPVFLVHNDHFKEYSLEEIRDFYEIQEPPETPARGGGKAPGKRAASPLEDEQFLGELSAMHFIEGPLDMPFEIWEAPKPAKTELATKRALWAEYQKISSQDVFGPSATKKKSPGYLFHNRYLAITEMFREWHNEYEVPFWNEKAPASWKTFEMALKASGRREILGRELQPLLEAHLKQYEEDLKAVKARLERIYEEERWIGRELREDPGLPAKGARITHVTSLVMVHTWETYRRNVADLLTEAEAHPEQKFDVTSVIDSKLQPPFMPMPEKAMSITF